MSVRTVGIGTLFLAGISLGALSLAIARREPASVAASCRREAAAELIAGWSLLAVGLVACARRRGRTFGPLLVCASFGWFLLEWNNPGIGSALGFALGLTLYAAATPFVAHAALVYPGRRLSSRLDRLALAAAYAGAIGVLGLAPALVFDPTAAVCTQCPSNLLLVRTRPISTTRSAGSVFTQDSCGHSGSSRYSCSGSVARPRRSAGCSGRCSYLPRPTSGWWPGSSRTASTVERSAPPVPSSGDLWLGQAGALIALAAGVVWGWIRARHTRAAVASLVVEAGASPAPGGLRDKLAGMLRDPSVKVAYRLDDGRLVDGLGCALVLDGEVTPLVRGGEDVALLSHRPGLLDDPALADEVAAAARLALENERLQAESRAQLEHLRTSRARVVAEGDAERRRLERDLHDGAQQRLVGLSLELGLTRSRLGSQPDAALLAQIDEAAAELETALDELRELAHGLFPALLAKEGLAAALEALTEEAPVEIEIGALPHSLSSTAEAAAYFVVSEAIKRSRGTPDNLEARAEGNKLVVELEADIAASEIVALEDRVGAAGGTLELERQADGRTRIRAELQCGS